MEDVIVDHTWAQEERPIEIGYQIRYQIVPWETELPFPIFKDLVSQIVFKSRAPGPGYVYKTGQQHLG